MQINGCEYKLIKIYKDKVSPLKDKFLVENKFGVKECFHRIDLRIKTARSKPREWTKEEIELICESLENGYTPTEISKKVAIANRTEGAILNKASVLKREIENDKR